MYICRWDLSVDTRRSQRGRGKQKCRWDSGWNGRKIGGGKRRDVGDKAKKKKGKGEGGKTRKVETTCRNNVRVFDLRHVTEPHWNQIGARERTLNWLREATGSLLREYLNLTGRSRDAIDARGKRRDRARRCDGVGWSEGERHRRGGAKGRRGALQRVKRATFLDFRINRHGAECAPLDYNGVYFDSDPL